MKRLSRSAVLLGFGFFVTGCAVDANPASYGESPPKNTPDLYSLDDNVADTVGILFGRNGNVTISMKLDEPLPRRAVSDAVRLAVTDGNGISVNMTSGERVDTIPEAPGQYMISVNKSREVLGFVCKNETIEGNSLKEGDDYRITIRVIDNFLFATETFLREVMVTIESCVGSDSCDAGPECQADAGCEVPDAAPPDECLPSKSRCADDSECCSGVCSGWWVSAVCQ